MRSKLYLALVGVVVVAAAAPTAISQDSPDVQIEAKPVPGQLDVLQGTALQLGGKPGDGAPKPLSYAWKIIEGEGGRLLNDDQHTAIFQAPTIETEMELFIIELKVEFENQDQASTRLHVRVHKQRPTITASETEWLLEHYRNLQENKRKRGRRGQRVVHRGHYPHWHFGFGFGWGWFVDYPVFIPIVVPPPGIDWGPGDGEWVEPAPIPYDDLVTTFPAEIAADYLPQDYPLDDMPEMGGSLDLPGGGDFDIPGGFDAPGGFDMPMDSFDMPMIDPGFDADPFGW